MVLNKEKRLIKTDSAFYFIYFLFIYFKFFYLHFINLVEVFLLGRTVHEFEVVFC